MKLMPVILLLPLVLWACSAKEGPGSLENPVDCQTLFGQSYSKGTTGVCALVGAYEHGTQTFRFETAGTVDKIFVSDVRWVEEHGQNGHRYFVTAIYRFDRAGYVTIERVFGSMDLTDRDN
tara:strand:+ start:186 stop:548 length:363 start_codon:yes stop_codon:yes gene_type:complete